MPLADDPQRQIADASQAQSDQRSARLKIRATQSLVSHMSYCWGHPSLVLIEVAWRWLFGLPFLALVWVQAQAILVQIPPASVGLDRVEFQNPWLSSVLLANAIAQYQRPVAAVLIWLLPSGLVAWSVVSGVGRMLLLKRMLWVDSGIKVPAAPYWKKLPSYIVLQGLWGLGLIVFVWLWFRAMGWVSATHITSEGQPDLVGYLCWLIFLSLGLYTLWALSSWLLAMAPLLLVVEDRGHTGNPLRALGQSLTLGRGLAGKLTEIGLVLAIVKIMLIVLDMVFSAAPLPFADQFGPDALNVLYVAVFVGFLLGNDFFHVVRLRSFFVLRRVYRDPEETLS